jgi:hypothetical protein
MAADSGRFFGAAVPLASSLRNNRARFIAAQQMGATRRRLGLDRLPIADMARTFCSKIPAGDTVA